MEAKRWHTESQEYAVERMYALNARHFTEVHEGYLNFGLWEPGVRHYVEAAENLVAHLGRALGLRRGARLLDVACGRGTQDFFLQQAFGPLEIDAIDVTWAHVEAARWRARKTGAFEKTRFHHGTAVDLPFTAGTFSHLLSIEGPVRFDTRERFFSEARRVLRRGGRIALADYVIRRLPKNAFERWVLDTTLSLWKVPLANAWTTKGYAEKLRSHRFENVEVKEVGELTFPGYYLEQRRLNFSLHKIRTQGLFTGGLAFLVDMAGYQAYRLGLIDYVLATAVRA